MARAAAATAALNHELNRLSGQQVAASRSSSVFVRDIERIGREAKGADTSINQLTGRLRLLGEALAILGPAAGPLGAAGIAGIGGLASQMGAAAIAGGVLMGSLQGVGDALKAMNTAQVDPTNKNLEKAERALKALSDTGREFAEAAFAMKPALVAIRDMGGEALFPGLTESLGNLERIGPHVANIFQTIAGTLGDIAADSTASLATERWTGFFEFVEQEIPDAITELAATVGSLTHGMVELWEATTPLNDDFSSWLKGVAAGFDQWASGLAGTEGFANFIDYVRTTGPQLSDTLGAIATAVIDIVQATAPLGGPVLASLEAVANMISSIADSDLGTPIMAGVAALSLLNRSLAITASLSKTSLSGGLFAGLGTVASGAQKGVSGFKGLGGDLAVLSRNFATAGAASERMAAQNAKALGNLKETGAVAGKAAGALGGLALVTSGAADGLGLTNTMSLALMGSLVPGGIVIGAAAGALLDMKAAGEGATAAIQGLDAAVQSGDIGTLKNQIAAAKAELADITNLDFGGDIFDRIGFQIADTFGGPSMDDARKKIKDSERALADLTQQQKLAEVRAKGAALAFLQQTGANVDLAKWSGRSTEEIKAQADAIIESREEADKTARSFVGLGDSLSDSKTSLTDWIKDMASTADALNHFTTNSIRAAKRGLDDGLIRSLQAAGPEGALRMRQLANGTKESIDDANAAFRKGEKAIERYNNYKVPPKKVTADTSRAMQSFREVDQYLSTLDGKTATTYVNTVRTVTGDLGAAVFGQKADGGTIPGPRHPYGDKLLYLLAPGEEVISNRHGQADKHRPLLKAINGGLAGGGTAGRKKHGSSAHLEVVEDTETEAQRRRRERREAEQAERERDREKREDEAQRNEERRLEHESKMFLAIIEGQERAAQGLIDAAQTQKDAAQAVADTWAQAMERTGAAATAGFRSDLFGGSGRHGLWSGPGGSSGSSWRDALLNDITGLQERSSLIAQLSGQGITGSALEAILSQGSNTDISELLASGQAGELAAMFAQREALLASVSGQAGQAAYGQEYAMAVAQVAALGNQILVLQQQLAAISAQRPINVYEAYSAAATAAEVARLQAYQGAA
jgi:hypothetical protein